MMRLMIVLALSLGLTSVALAQSGIDPNKWLVVDGIYENAGSGNPWCTAASQATAQNGLLTLTAIQGSFACQGHSASYRVGAMMSAPFSFTYGKVIWVAKLSPSGVHSTLWLWGGAPGTSGYPPNCIASIRAGGGYMGVCTADASNAYEIDMAELLPASTGVNIIHNNTHTWVNGTPTAPSLHQYSAGVDLSQAFHTYELDWTAGSLVFKLDGTTTNTISLTVGTFNQPMFLLMDQETDGTAGSGSFPNTMQVQSVQVFDANNNLIFFDALSVGFWFGVL